MAGRFKLELSITSASISVDGKEVGRVRDVTLVGTGSARDAIAQVFGQIIGAPQAQLPPPMNHCSASGCGKPFTRARPRCRCTNVDHDGAGARHIGCCGGPSE